MGLPFTVMGQTVADQSLLSKAIEACQCALHSNTVAFKSLYDFMGEVVCTECFLASLNIITTCYIEIVLFFRSKICFSEKYFYVYSKMRGISLGQNLAKHAFCKNQRQAQNDHIDIQIAIKYFLVMLKLNHVFANYFTICPLLSYVVSSS